MLSTGSGWSEVLLEFSVVMIKDRNLPMPWLDSIPMPLVILNDDILSSLNFSILFSVRSDENGVYSVSYTMKARCIDPDLMESLVDTPENKWLSVLCSGECIMHCQHWTALLKIKGDVNFLRSLFSRKVTRLPIPLQVGDITFVMLQQTEMNARNSISKLSLWCVC